MKTAISIPDPMFHAVERTAHRLGLSRSEVFQRAVQQYLQQLDDRGVTEALDAVYGESSSARGVDPLLDSLQIASLPRENW